MMRFSIIILCSCCGVLSCARKAETRTESLLMRSRSIQYGGYSTYLDGGSLGFVFGADTATNLVVFIPVPGAGTRPQQSSISNGTQLVQIAPGTEFEHESLFTIVKSSSAEQHLLALLATAWTTESDIERRRQIECLREIVKRRNFDWKKYYSRAGEKGFFAQVDLSLEDGVSIKPEPAHPAEPSQSSGR